jgi:hypothetical protein
VTAPQTPVYLDPDIAEILARCYRGERKRAVIARAVRMLATADGHLRPDGRIKGMAGVRRTPDDGPSVREAAGHDRNWDVEKAGE